MDAVLYDKRYVLEGLLNSIGLVVECMRIDLAVLSHSPPSDSSSNAGGKNPKPLPSTPKPKPQACGRQKNPQARNLRTLLQEAAEATVRSVELSKTQLSTLAKRFYPLAVAPSLASGPYYMKGSVKEFLQRLDAGYYESFVCGLYSCQ